MGGVLADRAVKRGNGPLADYYAVIGSRLASHASKTSTLSPISQSRDVTPAAIAGVAGDPPNSTSCDFDHVDRCKPAVVL